MQKKLSEKLIGLRGSLLTDKELKRIFLVFD